MKTKILALVLAAALAHYIVKEFLVMDSWHHQMNLMALLGAGVKEYNIERPDSGDAMPQIKDILGIFDEEFNDLEAGSKSLIRFNKSLGEKNLVIYWLSCNPDSSLVFVTISPLRSWFSGQYYRLGVNLEGEVVKIYGDEFINLILDSNFMRNALKTGR